MPTSTVIKFTTLIIIFFALLGNVDYISFVEFILTLTSGQSAGDVQCTELNVTADNIVETSESLMINIATEDVDVILSEPTFATITILDDDGKL